jgi:glycoside hydrolase-like protein
MIAVKAHVGQLGVDLDTPLSAASCAILKGKGISFVVRYLGDVTTSELLTVLDVGLLMGFVQHPRCAALTAALGQVDGQHAVQEANALNLPDGVTLWCDLESWTGDAISYVNEWSGIVTDAGFIAGLYVGYAAVPLTGVELAQLASTAYWRSISEVPEPQGVGFCMTQLRPGDQMLGALEIDYDVCEADFKGRYPVLAGS